MYMCVYVCMCVLSELLNDTCRYLVVYMCCLFIQFLQRLNIMDYSLLVGIHDPSIPRSAEVEVDEEEESEYMDDEQCHYTSSDELELPQSPSSTNGEFRKWHFHSSGSSTVLCPMSFFLMNMYVNVPHHSM